MKDEKVLPNDFSIVNRLMNELNDFGGNIAIPSKNQISELLSVAFWASIQKEEDRSLKPSFIYLKPDETSGELLFNNPLEFSVATTVKLSPAINESSKSILVYADENGVLKVFGVVNRSSFGLRIDAFEPGKLMVKYWNQIFMVFSEGKAKFFNNDNFDITNLLAKAIDEPDARKSYMIAGSILKITKTMFQQGHGGTIFVVNNESQTWKNHLTNLRYECHETEYIGISQLILPLFEERKFANPSDELERKIFSDGLMNEIDSIGKLTAVNGALIINSSLDVLGFGAMVKKGTEGMPETGILLEAGDLQNTNFAEIQLNKLGGARHNSALEFCFLEKTAIAIVASQDKTLSLVIWLSDDKKLAVLKNAQLYLD